MRKRRKLELVSLSIFIDDDVDEMFSSMMGCSEEKNTAYLSNFRFQKENFLSCPTC